MGFYGNITNTSRTTFQFDKIYPSRFEMDALCSTDGVYNGRYVLIEYDTNLNEQNYLVPWFVVQKAEQPDVLYGTVNGKTTYREISGQQIYGADLFEYAWETNATSFFNYFNGNSGAYPLSTEELEDYTLIYMAKGHVYKILNNEVELVLFNREGQYRTTDFQTFTLAMDWSEGSPSNWTYENVLNGETFNESFFNEHGAYWPYIANGVCRPADASIWDFHTDKTWLPGFVRVGRHYEYNPQGEFWQIDHDTTFQYNEVNTYSISKLTTITDNFTTNFNKDKQYYKSSRGYDSTVWQKVIVNGIEKYVMIAELNTVVPTFGITADPPSLLPINPHWGSDSTNVYYDLHWQPQWGFRVKAADYSLTTPILDPSGEMYTSDVDGYKMQNQFGTAFLRDVTRDATFYPSDEQVTWKSSFEDKTKNQIGFDLFYNPQTKTWDQNSANKVPAAIYYNKAGFNSSVISYSGDLIDDAPEKAKYGLYRKDLVDTLWQNTDTINFSATGLSGNIYNRHDGFYGKKPQVDTQELSIMLPSIGNILASVWDLIYGGRETSSDIKLTNKRNKDITWENGPDHLYRLGLRLRGTDGNQYNTKAVETLAGCINTAHDLFGMIIVPKTAEELEDVDKLNDERIYYNSDDGEYYRKHITYEYTPLKEEDYNYIPVDSHEPLNTSKIHNGCYYIYVVGNYVNVQNITDPSNPKYEYDPNTTYYYKSVTTQYVQVPNEPGSETTNLKTFPYNGYEWFVDFQDDTTDLEKANYIKNPKYQETKQYYKVAFQEVQVGSDFQSGKYFYKQDNEYLIEDSDEPVTEHEPYYEINEDVFTNRLSDFSFDAVYIPGKYYYKDKNTGNYLIDNSPDGRNIRQYGEIDYDGTLERRKCYILQEPVIRQDTSGENVLYKQSIYYSLVSDITAQTYIPGFYYIQLSSGQYSKTFEEFNPETQYYVQEIQYIKLNPTDTSYEIDTDTVFFLGSMCIYRDDTYFIKRYNVERTKVIGYTCLSLQYINDNFTNLDTTNIFTVGSYPSIADDPYYGLPGYNRIQDGIPWMTLDNSIFIESYKKEQDPSYEPLIQTIDKFYFADTYHYITPEGSLILDRKSIQSDFQYCIITSVEGPLTGVDFVEGDEYYYNDGNDFVEVQPGEVVPSEVFVKSGVYVYEDNMSDPEEKLELGQEWNLDALCIPNGITLATRKKKYELVKMPNYAITNTTINGLFLDIVRSLEKNDRLTRDDTIVAGSVNKLRDILARFNHMRSRELVLIDDVGRVHSTPVETLQKTSLQIKENIAEYDDCIEKDIYPEAASVNAMEKQWISVNVDGNVNHPQVTVHHNFQPVTNTPSTYNLNNNTTVLSNHTVGTGNNSYNTDNIELYKPIVDEMGHIVGHQSKILTLPYDFKELRTNGQGTNTVSDNYLTVPVNLTSNTNTITAGNTQDYFRVDSYDPWILMDATQSNHTLRIAHKVSSVYKTLTALSNTPILIGESDNANHFNNYVGSALTYNYNDSGINTNKPLVLWYYTFDKAGHVNTQTATSVTLPYSWKKIQVNNTPTGVSNLLISNDTTSVIPINTVDTLSFNATNKWIRMIAETDTNNNHIISLGHLVQTIPATTDSYDFNTGTAITGSPDFSIVTDNFDEAGHQIAKLTTSYKLPYTWQRISVNAASSNESISTGQSAASYKDATTLLDNFTFVPGNKYITLTLNGINKTLTIGHAGAGEAIVKSGNHTSTEAANGKTINTHSSLTPRVNDTFKVPYVTIDPAGHVSYLGEDTIKIPGYTVNNVVVNDSLSLNGSTIDLNPIIWTAFGTDDTNNTLDSLKVYRISAGKLPINSIADFLSGGNPVYYNASSAINLLAEDNNANIVSNRLQMLNKTDNYATTNTLSQLTTIHFQRSQWLTDIIESLDSSINLAENSTASTDENHLKVISGITQTDGLLSYETKKLSINMEDVNLLNNTISNIDDDIDGINNSISGINSSISTINDNIDGIDNSISTINSDISNINTTTEGLQTQIDNLNQSVYIEADPENEIEEKTVTIQELTSRVALLENIIKRIVAQDSTLDTQALEELLAWNTQP